MLAPIAVVCLVIYYRRVTWWSQHTFQLYTHFLLSIPYKKYIQVLEEELFFVSNLLVLLLPGFQMIIIIIEVGGRDRNMFVEKKKRK